MYSLKIGGKLTCSNGDSFTIRVVTNCGLPSEAEFCSQVVQIDGNQSNSYFELEIDFAVRSAGIAGTAEILTNGSFDYFNKTNVKKGYGFNQLNNSTFDTTIDNELCVTYQTAEVDSFTVDVASITKYY